MSTLYPRLLPGETQALFDALGEHSIEELRARSDVRSDRAVFAASGGTRVSEDGIRALAGAIRKIADAHGYPNAAGRAAVVSFDSRVGRMLHETSGMVPGEAAQPQVWAFLALVVLPDVCVWRWPAGSNGRFVVDRFKGTDLTRHALGRLWTRAHVLREPESYSGEDRYHLLDALGEADLDQIMARRRSVAASPALVREVVRIQHEARRDADGTGERAALRQILIRLLRLTAFLDLDSYDVPGLRRLVLEVRHEALAHLANSSDPAPAPVG